ncbi:MAG: hypothetical protein M3008_12085 [Chloroflexota bacterium]|nr:hypothetical protein [Chloroflexota bacterium]
MFHRLRHLCAVGAIGAALLVIGMGSTGSVSAAIDPVAFQKLGCNNGDYTCYYARLYGGYPLQTPFCDNTGCTYAAVGEGYFSVPYYTTPSFAGYPYGYAYPAYVNSGGVPIALQGQGGFITSLNH